MRSLFQFHLIATILIALLFSGCVFLSESENQISTSLESPLLWEVEGGKSKSWLFGTIHVGVSAKDDLPPIVWDKLKGADCFIMETDLTRMDPQELSSMARLPEKKRLSKMISAKNWRKLKIKLAHIIPEPFLDESKPWFVILNYMQLLFPPNSQPMDLSFLEAAKAQNKELLYLEDWKTQIRAIEKSSTVKDLVQLIEKDEDASAQIELLINAYKSGDTKQLHAAMFSQTGVYTTEKQIKILLDDRNFKWLPQISKIIKEKSCFVAVGAGHMLGKNGLLSLLKKKNFKTRRID